MAPASAPGSGLILVIASRDSGILPMEPGRYTAYCASPSTTHTIHQRLAPPAPVGDPADHRTAQVRGPKEALPAQTHHGRSLELPAAVGRLWARCGHDWLLYGATTHGRHPDPHRENFHNLPFDYTCASRLLGDVAGHGASAQGCCSRAVLTPVVRPASSSGPLQVRGFPQHQLEPRMRSASPISGGSTHLPPRRCLSNAQTPEKVRWQTVQATHDRTPRTGPRRARVVHRWVQMAA